jgi:hypothetical protein
MWNEDDHPRKADGEFIHASAGAWARDAAASLRVRMAQRGASHTGPPEGFMPIRQFHADYAVRAERDTDSGLAVTATADGEYQLRFNDPDHPEYTAHFADFSHAEMRRFRQAIQQARGGEQDDSFAVTSDDGEPMFDVDSDADGAIILYLDLYTGVDPATGRAGDRRMVFELPADEAGQLEEAVSDVLDADITAPAAMVGRRGAVRGAPNARFGALTRRSRERHRAEAAPAARQRRTPQGTPIGQWMAQVNDQMERR